ncbi:AMP-binding protein, partial [Adlercreutzia sp. DFI.6.23]
DENGQEVPRGAQGEEISRGPHMFVGYLNEHDRTDRALTDDGWFFSGDLCYMDEEGRIRINGRKKEVIIRGGENISAREIDEDIIGAPGLSNSATIGM